MTQIYFKILFIQQMLHKSTYLFSQLHCIWSFFPALYFTSLNSIFQILILFFNSHPRTCLLINFFRERGREKERKKHVCERETSIGCPPMCAPSRGQPTA